MDSQSSLIQSTSSPPRTSNFQSSSTTPSPLAAKISSSLPAGTPPLNIHHISHPATRCDPLYSPPYSSKPARTTLTSQFLALSLASNNILIYAIEIHIYSTRDRSTLFVSKADSSGFFPQSAAGRPSISPVRAITTAFLEYLLDLTKKAGVTRHLTLFARAQDQYLFPNSVRNKGKHVLSDIQLIRWWARVLDPVVTSSTTSEDEKYGGTTLVGPTGYILVPGLERVELRNVFPKDSKRWIHGHPYDSPDRPVRECIPHFEDDPKTRFMDELEEQGWKGARSMKEFWELMAFRQECSLGKSVGFLSVVLEAEKRDKARRDKDVGSEEGGDSQVSVKSDEGSQRTRRRSPDAEGSQGSPKRKKLKLPIDPADIHSASTFTIASLLRNPSYTAVLSRRSSGLSRASSYASNASESGSGPGGKVLTKKDYDRLMTSLMDSDFEGLKLAKESSELWIRMAGAEPLPFSEKQEPVMDGLPNGAVAVNTLTVRKKGAEPVPIINTLQPRKKPDSTPVVNTLQPRKKTDEPATTINVLQPRKKTDTVEAASSPIVNVLQPRKKTKDPEPTAESVPIINVLQPRKKEKEKETPAQAQEVATVQGRDD